MPFILRNIYEPNKDSPIFFSKNIFQQIESFITLMIISFVGTSTLFLNHGKSYWKFNDSLLNDIEYINHINSKNDYVIKQYCLPTYNVENVLQIDRSEI